MSGFVFWLSKSVINKEQGRNKKEVLSSFFFLPIPVWREGE